MVLFLISQPMKSVVRLAGSMSLNWPTTPMNNSVTGVPTRDSPGSTAAAALASGMSQVRAIWSSVPSWRSVSSAPLSVSSSSVLSAATAMP